MFDAHTIPCDDLDRRIDEITLVQQRLQKVISVPSTSGTEDVLRQKRLREVVK